MKEEISRYFHTIFDTLDTKHAHLLGATGSLREDLCERMADEVIEIVHKYESVSGTIEP